MKVVTESEYKQFCTWRNSRGKDYDDLISSQEQNVALRNEVAYLKDTYENKTTTSSKSLTSLLNFTIGKCKHCTETKGGGPGWGDVRLMIVNSSNGSLYKECKLVCSTCHRVFDDSSMFISIDDKKIDTYDTCDTSVVNGTAELKPIGKKEVSFDPFEL